MSVSKKQHGGGVLKPTLWRTCRALANDTRLRMFQYLLKHPNQTVSEVAAAMHLSISIASQYLRALNARGLLCAQRHAGFVRYAVAPDPAVPETRGLVMALRESLCKGTRQERAVVFRILTAFTHPRRVEIMAVLHTFPACTVRELARQARIPRTSLERHLKKLESRGFVVWRRCRWFRRPMRQSLARVLLQHVVSNSR